MQELLSLFSDQLNALLNLSCLTSVETRLENVSRQILKSYYSFPYTLSHVYFIHNTFAHKKQFDITFSSTSVLLSMQVLGVLNKNY